MRFTTKKLEQLLRVNDQQQECLTRALVQGESQLEALTTIEGTLLECLVLAQAAESLDVPLPERLASEREIARNMSQLFRFLKERKEAAADPDFWLLETVDWDCVSPQ